MPNSHTFFEAVSSNFLYTMLTLQQVISENNAGIELLKSGSFSQAVKCFNRAFSVVTNLVMVDGLLEFIPYVSDPVLKKSASKRKTKSLEYECIRGSCWAHVVDIIGVSVVLDEDVSPGNIFSLYNRVFMFEASNIDPIYSTAVTYQLKRELSACIVYNMAFTCHLAGIFGGVGAEKDHNLSQANRIYKTLLGILPSRVSTHQNDCHSATLLVVSLALLTNLGFIESHNQRRDNALRYRDQLRILFTDITEYIPDILPREAYGFFCFNVIFSLSIDMTVACAA